jgi:hypothetical protein
VQSEIVNIQDPLKREDARKAADEAGAIFYSSQTDEKEITYQWTSPLNSNISYTVATNTKWGPSFNQSERVAKDEVAEQLDTLKTNYDAQKTEIQADLAKNFLTAAERAELTAALVALETNYAEQRSGLIVALVLGNAFYVSLTPKDDKVYQWTNFSNSNVSYSMTAYPQWNEATFNRSERVSWQSMWEQVVLLDSAYELQRQDITDKLNEPMTPPLTAGERTDLEALRRDIDAEHIVNRKTLIEGLVSGHAFYKSQVGTKDPSYQWTSALDPDVSYSISINTHVPRGTQTNLREDGVEVSVTKTTRIDPSVVKDEAALVADPDRLAQALAAASELGAIFYRSQTNGKEIVYQWSSPKNSNVNYTISTSAEWGPSFSQSERVAKDEVAGQLETLKTNYEAQKAEIQADLEKTSLTPAERSELTAALTTLEANYAEQRSGLLAALAMGDAFFVSLALAKTAAGATVYNKTYQWTNFSNPNVSYTVASYVGWGEVAFNRTKRVSWQTMWEQVVLLKQGYDEQIEEKESRATGLSEGDPILTELRANIANLQKKYAANRQTLIEGLVVGRAFYVSQVGSKDPSYQWTSALDPNVSYSISVNKHVPRGTEAEPLADGTEVSISRTERVSRESIVAASVLGLIADPAKKAEAQLAVSQAGALFYRTVTDGKDPVYQWTSPQNSNVSYTISLNSKVPEGLSNNPTGRETTFNRNERIQRSEVKGWIAKMADPLKRAKALHALIDGTAFYKAQAGNDDASYQWSSFGHFNLNYTVSTKSWGEAHYSSNRRVSWQELWGQTAILNEKYREDVASVKADDPDRISKLAALRVDYDQRMDAIQKAMASAEAVYQSEGDKGFVFQWTSSTTANTSYSLAQDNFLPQGTPEEGLPYRRDLNFTATERVSIDVMRSSAVVEMIPELDAAKKAQALAAIEELGSIFYRSKTNDDVPVYQWSSPSNADVSYSISFDTKVPVGTAQPQEYVTHGKFNRTVRVSFETVLSQMAFVKDPVRRDAGNLALADGDLFTMSQAGDDDPTYQWSSFKDPNVSYTLRINTRVPTGTEAIFSKSTRVSREEVGSTVVAPAPTPSDLMDDRFSTTQTIQQVLMGDVMANGIVTDSNWQNVSVQIIEEVVGNQLMRTGYQVTSQDGKITRMVYLDYEAQSDAEKIVYVEKSWVDPGALLIGTQTARDLILGDLKDAPGWSQQPVYRIRKSYQSFSNETRSVENDYYGVTSQDGALDVLLTIEYGVAGLPQYTRISPATREEVLSIVPLMRDAAMREAALLAIGDLKTVFYKVESQYKEISYQWTSSANSSVSYSIVVDEKVPIGSGPTEQFTKEATFTTQTRISREAMFALVQQQEDLMLNPVDGVATLTPTEMKNLKEALQETNILTVFTKQESIDARAGNTLRYSWESLDKLKSCSLSDNPPPII